MPSVKLGITLPDHVLEQLDATSKHLGLNRSAMLTVMIMNYIEQREGLKAMQSISSLDDLLKMAQGTK